MSYEVFTRKFDDSKLKTNTTTSLLNSEASIKHFLNDDFKLYIESHIKYCLDFINSKSERGMKSEPFSPWNVAYSLVPLRILGYNGPDLEDILERCTSFLESRTTIHGGFSGHNTDNPHLITNYAAIIGISLIGSTRAYDIIDRQKLYKCLMELKMPNGAFKTTLDMEYDVRSTFAAVLIADIFNITTPELIEGVVDFVLSCQNFDGGFSPRPGLESHGGYVHCAVGILKILNKLDLLNFNSITRWIAARQMEFSGGFQGRPNKLVDSCYSWWIGSACRIIADHLGVQSFWDEYAMAQYIIRSSQFQIGGFCDHSPSRPDHFHTMYALAGLCVCGGRNSGEGNPIELPEVDPLLCCPKYLADQIRSYFKAKPFVPE